MATPTEHLRRERTLRRLVSGDDPELLAALERMRLNHYHLWLVLEELRTSEDPGALIAVWGLAPEGSVGWRKALFRDDALEVLRVALSNPAL